MNTNPMDSNISSSAMKPVEPVRPAQPVTKASETSEGSISGVLAIERGDTRVVRSASDGGIDLRLSSDKVNDFSDPPSLRQEAQNRRSLVLEGNGLSSQLSPMSEEEEFLDVGSCTQLMDDSTTSPSSSPRISRGQVGETTATTLKTEDVIQNVLQSNSAPEEGQKTETELKKRQDDEEMALGEQLAEQLEEEKKLKAHSESVLQPVLEQQQQPDLVPALEQPQVQQQEQPQPVEEQLPLVEEQPPEVAGQPRNPLLVQQPAQQQEQPPLVEEQPLEAAGQPQDPLLVQQPALAPAPEQAQLQAQIQPQPQVQVQQPLAQAPAPAPFPRLADVQAEATRMQTDFTLSSQKALRNVMNAVAELGGEVKLQADMARNPDGSYKVEPFTLPQQAPGKTFYKIEATYTVLLKDADGNPKMHNGQPVKVEFKRYIYTEATDPKDAPFLAGTYQSLIVKLAKGKINRLENFPAEGEQDKRNTIKDQQSFRLFCKLDSKNHPTSLTSIQVDARDDNNKPIHLKPVPPPAPQAGEVRKKYVRNLFEDQQIAKHQEDSGKSEIGKVVYQTKEEALRYAPYTVSDPGIYNRFASDPSKLDELHKKIAEKEKEFEELQKEFKEKRFFGMSAGKESAKYQQFLVDTKAYETFKEGKSVLNLDALSLDLQNLIKTKEKLQTLVGDKNPQEVLRDIRAFSQALQNEPAARVPRDLESVFDKQKLPKTEELLSKFIKKTEDDFKARNVPVNLEHTQLMKQLGELKEVAKEKGFEGDIPLQYAREHAQYREVIKQFNEYVLKVKVEAIERNLETAIRELPRLETAIAQGQVAFNEQLLHLQDVNRELRALTQELKDIRTGARDAIVLATASLEEKTIAGKIDAKIPDKRIAELERNNGAHGAFIKNIVFDLKALGVNPSAPPVGAVRPFAVAEDLEALFR